MRYIGLCVSVMLLSACSSQPASVGLSTRVGASRGAAAALGQTRQRLEVSNGITVERVRLAVRKLELKQEGDDGLEDDTNEGGTADDRSGDDSERRMGPFLVDLASEALDGQVIRLRDVQVETGTYDKIEFEVEKVSITEAGEDAGLKEMAQLEASVVIDGSIDGQPFRFVSGLSVEQEREARFVVRPEEGQNVTINIDPRAWFTGADGRRLDPREDGFRSEIENSIKRSIDAFDDDDEDGGEDHDDDDGDASGEDEG